MEFSYKTKVNATKERIWSYYEDIQKWYVWEDDLESITLDGDFKMGSTGEMKLADMPPMAYTLTTVIENEAFFDKTSTPFGDIYFKHQIIEENDGIYVKHSVQLQTDEVTLEKLGFLRQVFNDVPDSIMLLKAEVER